MSAISKFLSQYKVISGSPFTHTSLKGGSYYVPTTDMDTFMEIYKVALVNGDDIYLTEKHRETSPILIDLDFRHESPDRLYTDVHIIEFLTALKKQITDYIEVTDDMLQFFVLEKPEPRKNKSGGYKDGIHIVCPYIVTKADVQYVIRQNIIKNDMRTIFGDTFTNSDDDIYDVAVIEINNWFLYGSKKPDEEYPWAVSKIYNANLQEVDCMHTDEDLVDLLSIRNKFDDLPLKADKVDEVKAYKESKQKPKSEEASTSKTVVQLPSNMDTIEKLVMMLKPERADDYKEWIKWGICLKSINNIYLIIWTEFSKQSSKYQEGECERVWKTLPQGTMTEGTLRYFAKMDNPEEYRKLMSDSVETLIYNSRNETHTDIAKVAHFLFKDEIVCCYANEKPFWYMFENHRWRLSPDGIALKLKISNELSKHYNLTSSRYSIRASNVEEEDEQKRFAEVAKKLSSIAMKLKTAQFKSNVFKECKELFYVSTKDFYEKLDENKYLIGFENGVYDMETCTFRQGMPSDFLTYSVGYNYIEEPNMDYLTVLKQLIYSMFPEDVAQFMLNAYSYGLCGVKYMEFLMFWIGTGANGKGVSAKLLQKTFGDYCYCPDVSVFTTKKTSSSNANPELAKTKGKRLIIATEPNEDDKFQVGAIKAWTGGDTIQARQLYKDTIEFQAQFLIIIQMNHKPELSDFDQGIARRLKNVEFEYKFVENPQLPHEKKGDCSIKKKIEDDIMYAQNFMWLLLKNYETNLKGNQTFDTPEKVQNFTKQYLDANNKIGAFLAEYCEITNKDEDMIKTKDLFDTFKTSDFYNGKDQGHFTEHMGQCGFKSTKCKSRGAYRDKCVFYGLKMKVNDDGYMFYD